MPASPTNPVRARTRILRVTGAALVVAASLHLGLSVPEAARADDGVGFPVDPALARLKSSCDAGTPGAWDALVDWAEANDRTNEIESWLRRRLTVDPNAMGAHDALDRLCADRSLPAHSVPYHAARSLLPSSFLEYETKRFIVLSDAESGWTREQAARLERSHHQFQRFAKRIGVRPLPLRHKLVCVLFDSRQDYQQFARNHDDVADPWIAGYYAPLTDRVVFYQGEANPSVVEARARLEQMRDDLDRATAGGRQAENAGGPLHSALHEHRHEYIRHLERERQRVDAFADQVSIATTVHEAVHQLMFHTGVQSLAVQYPLWISEGLATAFETDAPDNAFGPDFEYGPRREAFDELLRADQLVSMRDLLAWTRIPTSDEHTVHVVYHQSYALVTWLSRYRRAQFRTYLDRMRREPAGVPAVVRQLALFEDAFGAIEDVERAWLRHEHARVQATVTARGTISTPESAATDAAPGGASFSND